MTGRGIEFCSESGENNSIRVRPLLVPDEGNPSAWGDENLDDLLGMIRDTRAERARLNNLEALARIMSCGARHEALNALRLLEVNQ